jgi:5,5'-dehydrodivanillate O-demethylase
MEHTARSTRGTRLQQLTQVGPDTSMGRLLRQFWQPLALSASVASGTARALDILGERLTLFRGASGVPHVVGGRCAHRCTVLHTGWIEGDQIRCMYHGWRYDGTGTCTEMPAERVTPESARIASYPVHEYCGVIFAYMGNAPAPSFDLPRKAAFEIPGNVVIAREQVWDCNWFQQVENSLDSVHVSFVHQWGRLGRFGSEVTTALPELHFEETSSGIRQTAIRGKDNVRISDWTFPNNNHIVSAAFAAKGEPWVHTGVWAVPIDEVRTARFTIVSIAPATKSAELALSDPHADFNPADHYDELFATHRIPEQGLGTGLGQSQDYVALRGQGPIADRENERLGASDAGIALLRRICFRELDAIANGSAPKSWQRHDEPSALPQPGEPTHHPASSRA